MKKAAFASLALLFLPITAFATTEYEISGFSDVSNFHPNAEAVAYMKAQGIVQGYADGTFSPEKTINRAEFVKILVEAYFPGQADSIKESDGRQCFNDVSINDQHEEWFSKYVCFAQAQGIVSGYAYVDSMGMPLSVFSPGRTINFAEAAKIVANTAQLDVRAPDLNLPWYKPFSDALSRSSAIPATIRGYGSSITRGEMAEIIYRLKANIMNKPSLNYPELALFKVLTNDNGWSIKYG